ANVERRSSSVPSSHASTTPETITRTGSGGENLVEENLGLVLVGPLGERELADQDLPGLGEHALLPRGQPTLPVPTPQVANDLGHLVHVARGELLEVGLVTPRPVGRLFRVGCAQHLEDLVQTFLTDDIADADDLSVRR